MRFEIFFRKKETDLVARIKTENLVRASASVRPTIHSTMQHSYTALPSKAKSERRKKKNNSLKHITGAKKIIQLILVDFSPIFCIINFFFLVHFTHSLTANGCPLPFRSFVVRSLGTFVFCTSVVVTPLWGF